MAGAIVLLFLVFFVSVHDAQKPNIVLLFADDVSAYSLLSKGLAKRVVSSLATAIWVCTVIQRHRLQTWTKWPRKDCYLRSSTVPVLSAVLLGMSREL